MTALATTVLSREHDWSYPEMRRIIAKRSACSGARVRRGAR
jgi:hypothetical protein